VLLVQHLVFNEGTHLTDGLRQAMTQALAEYAAFNGCEQWQLVRAAPALISWLSSDGDNSNITKS
jgi:hypothetical protein